MTRRISLSASALACPCPPSQQVSQWKRPEDGCVSCPAVVQCPRPQGESQVTRGGEAWRIFPGNRLMLRQCLAKTFVVGLQGSDSQQLSGDSDCVVAGTRKLGQRHIADMSFQ